MILHFAILLSFQLVGEVFSRLAFPSAPGPVIGLALLVFARAIFPKLADELRKTVNGFLAHLSLFFIPAGVGIVTQLPQIGADGFGDIRCDPDFNRRRHRRWRADLRGRFTPDWGWR